MANPTRKARLETEAIVIGYAMSRLDKRYLVARRCSTWKQAFQEASDALSVRPASFKNLRDEFDPIHGNLRRGWHQRVLRPNRQRVLSELCEVSDEALLELVSRIMNREEEETAAAIDALVTVPRVAYNVAERLLTGRLAEEFFLANSDHILQIARERIVDVRQAAQGFDFAVRDEPDYAIEVKGLKQARGDLLFTDREWREARARRHNYRLVVVGNLAARPVPRVVPDPSQSLQAKCLYQASLAVVWRTTVSVSA